jgi:hypothetical protein
MESRHKQTVAVAFLIALSLVMCFGTYAIIIKMIDGIAAGFSAL